MKTIRIEFTSEPDANGHDAALASVGDIVADAKNVLTSAGAKVGLIYIEDDPTN